MSLYSDEYYLDIALKEAEKALLMEEVPVGCVVRNNVTETVICSAHNLTNRLSDPLAHAELLCVEYMIKNNLELSGHTFYITLEPCAMCVGILERIQADVVFGYRNDIFGSLKILNKESGKCLKDERCIDILKRFYETPNRNIPTKK